MAGIWIKICGITREDDAHWAMQYGADALGFNFYSRSPRFISMDLAEKVAVQVAPCMAVALFVNGDLLEITEQVCKRPTLHTVQWHGDPPLPSELAPIRLIPAFAVRDRLSLQAIEHYLHRCRNAGSLPFAVLVDAHVPGQYGGTGRTVPWHLLADFQPGVPLILAGGLTPDNVAEAIRTVRPFGVDVASGVEVQPGCKDLEKLRRFIDNARAAAAGLS